MTRRTLIVLGAIAAVLAAASYWVGQQAYAWMPVQASAESALVDDLFSFMVTIAAFIVFGITGTLLYAALFQRAERYDTSDGPPIEGNVTLEAIWTAIPAAIVVWTATYSYQIYDQMGLLGPGQHFHLMGTATAAETREVPKAPVVEVRSRQWVWEFYYPDRDVLSTELHLPANQRARLQLTSEDVIHGMYIPAFRVKQDIIPGRTIAFEFTPTREGRYRLRDSELSGTYFAVNQTNVVVESEADFQQWLATAASQPRSRAENVPYQEYQTTEANVVDLGWSTISPAAPPLINFSSSESDSYE